MSDSPPGAAGATPDDPDRERWFLVRDRAAYLPDADALVIADLHLGRARTSNVEFPLPERASVERRLAGLVDAFDPRRVVLAGDVCHAFGTAPEGVAESLDAIRERVADAGAGLVVVRGNHDPMLDSLADPVSEHRLGDGTLICHGHEDPGDADRYVIGHEHPAIDIEGRRHPCFLWGEGVHSGSDVLAVPAFTELAAGTPVNTMRGRDAQSPLLSDLGAFRPLVREADSGETFVFPPLSSFRELL
jgi:putative SbcD/Mre11-related phosphoesterase